MKLVNPSWEILEQKPGLEGIYEQIELAGRTCYRSQRPEGQTAKDFVDRMIASKHYAMLEHGTVYLTIPFNRDIKDWGKLCNKYSRNPYSKVHYNNYVYGLTEAMCYITTNLRVLVENDWLDDLQYLCEPTKFHEKRVTVRFTTSNSIMREFTRHRSHSFAVESTRYCNYSKNRFNKEITFVAPYWYDKEAHIKYDRIISGAEGWHTKIPKEVEKTGDLIDALTYAEESYLHLIEDGCSPQEAREVLPLATKCDMIMTGFIRDWRHFFSLRTSIIAETGKPHPDASFLADSLYREFKNRHFI